MSDRPCPRVEDVLHMCAIELRVESNSDVDVGAARADGNSEKC